MGPGYSAMFRPTSHWHDKPGPLNPGPHGDLDSSLRQLPPIDLLSDPPRWPGPTSRLNPAAAIIDLDLFDNPPNSRLPPSSFGSRLPPSSSLSFGSRLLSWSPSTTLSTPQLPSTSRLPTSQAPTEETDPLNPGPSSPHGNTDLNPSPYQD